MQLVPGVEIFGNQKFEVEIVRPVVCDNLARSLVDIQIKVEFGK